MPSAHTYTFHSADPAELDRVLSEYLYIGRNAVILDGKVVVYPYPKAKPAKAKREARPRPDADEEKPKVDHTQKSKRERWYE